MTRASPPRLVPELLVSDLAASLRFWCGRLGFAVVYERPAEGFALLERDGARVMLEERGRAARTWETGPLEPPLGRGVNFELTVAALAPLLAALDGVPLFADVEERTYALGDDGDATVRVRQCCVQDPDGYLVRLAEELA